MSLSRKAAPFVENMSEAAAACLVTMVQGNLLAISVGHWIVASQTGIVAGGVTATAIALARTDRPWIVSAVLGTATAVVDYLVHPGMFGPAVMEALVTGAAAAALSWGVTAVVRRVRAARAPA